MFLENLKLIVARYFLIVVRSDKHQATDNYFPRCAL